MIPIFLPPLQHMAAVSVALLLYKTEDIQRFVEENDSSFITMTDGIRDEDWDHLKEATAEKMGLLLPIKLKSLVVEILRPLHGELQKWKMDHYFLSIYTNKSIFPHIVSWRSDGTVYRTKTAKILIQNKTFSPVERFLMSCMYFQQNEIETLWDEVKDDLRLENINGVFRFWVKWLTEGSEGPWTDLVDEHLGDPIELHSFCTFRASCFFRALSSENRQKYSAYLGNTILHFESLQSCIYQMDESERNLLYQKSSKKVLILLLRWPFQSIFVPTVKQLWEYLQPFDFYLVLHRIVNSYILKDLKYFDFLELFKEFWHNSPDSYKDYIKETGFFKLVELLLSYNVTTGPFSIKEVREMYEHLTIF